MQKRSFLTPDNEIKILKENGYSRIVGIDEAGRGCWAGPVAVGAFIVNLETPTLEKITDSKMLSQKDREAMFTQLSTADHKVKFGEPNFIDEIGIGNAVTSLIQSIVEELDNESTYFLIDGRFSVNFGKNTLQVVKGDSKYYSIAAASILAKVKRDNLMCDLSKEYPEYMFDQHKGYGTKLHRELLEKHGICVAHRKSYKPIKQLSLL